MKPFILVLGFALAGLMLLPRLSGQIDEAEKQKTAALMQRKLERAQKVLDGISTGDFEKIIKNAEDLSDISKQVGWRVLKTPTYEMFSADFQRAAQALVKSGREKNLDSAALAYVDLTLTCVKCHKHVREVRMVRAD